MAPELVMARIPGGRATLRQALAHPQVAILSSALGIDLADEAVLTSVLADAIAIMEKGEKPPASSSVSAGFSLAFGLVGSQRYVQAALRAYREMGAL